MWERQPCHAFHRKEKGYHEQENIIFRNDAGKISLFPSRIPLVPDVINDASPLK